MCMSAVSAYVSVYYHMCAVPSVCLCLCVPPHVCSAFGGRKVSDSPGTEVTGGC